MSVLARQQARQSGNLPPLKVPLPAECPSAHSQKTIRPSEPRTGRSARHCGRAAEQARVCRRAPGSAMSPLHGHSPWPATVAGGAAVGQTGPATLVLGDRSRVCNSWPISAQVSSHHRALRALAPNSLRSVFYSPT